MILFYIILSVCILIPLVSISYAYLEISDTKLENKLIVPDKVFKSLNFKNRELSLDLESKNALVEELQNKLRESNNNYSIIAKQKNEITIKVDEKIAIIQALQEEISSKDGRIEKLVEEVKNMNEKLHDQLIKNEITARRLRSSGNKTSSQISKKLRVTRDLTFREFKILQLISQKKSKGEISKILKLKSNELHRILVKLKSKVDETNQKEMLVKLISSK